jgi:hypothetical protein
VLTHPVEPRPVSAAARHARAARLPRGTAAFFLLVLLAVHVFVARDASAPVWMDDELGYLSNAELLSGVGDARSLAAIGYYSGWSIPIVPLWWLFDDPGTVYRAAIVLSVLAGVAVVFPLAALARRFGLRQQMSVVLAAVVAMAPARSFMSGYVLAENLLAFLVAVTAVAALRFSERPTVARAASLGGLAAACFFTHGRVVPLVGATVVWFLATARRSPRVAAWGLGTSLGGAAAAHLTNSLVIRAVYDSPTDREGAALDALLHIDVPAALTALVGLGWYQLAAWAGLPLLGVAVSLRRSVGELRAGRPDVWTWWCVGGAGVLLISASSVASAITRNADRVDIYTYGRYVEPLFAVLATVALATVVTRMTARAATTIVTASALVVVLFLGVVVPRVPDAGRLSPINAAGLMPWSWKGVVPAASGHPWAQASLVGLLVLLVLCVLRSRAARALAVVGIVFATGSVAGEVRSMRTFDGPWHTQAHVLAETVEYLGLDSVGYDVRDSEAIGRNGYQFWLAPRPVPVFDSAEGPPTTDVVLARHSWAAGQAWGAVKIAEDPRFDEALWVMPGVEHERLRRGGYLLHEPEGTTLPDGAYTYDLRVRDLPEQLKASHAHGPELHLRLRHTGTGAPWPSIRTGPDVDSGPDAGYVRLVLYWQRPGGQSPQIVDLPRTLMPGEEIDLDVPLVPPADVPEGPTRVRIGLIQEGVRPFEPPGTELTVLDVAVDG